MTSVYNSRNSATKATLILCPDQCHITKSKIIASIRYAYNWQCLNSLNVNNNEVNNKKLPPNYASHSKVLELIAVLYMFKDGRWYSSTKCWLFRSKGAVGLYGLYFCTLHWECFRTVLVLLISCGSKVRECLLTSLSTVGKGSSEMFSSSVLFSEKWAFFQW